nr:hypothetical protein [Anaerolineae bacterium]
MMTTLPRNTDKQSVLRWLLLLIVLATLAQGITRLFVAPLWAHYDEPTHYEYARYIIQNNRIPAEGQYDLSITDRIIETYGDADVELSPPGHQFKEVPGYYLLVALPQFVLQPDTVRQEVFIARSVSVILLVAVALLGYLTVKTAFPDKPLLAFGVPLIMSMIIGFVDLMSAMSNDVGAVFAYSLLVYALTLLLSRKIKWRTVLLALLAAGLCLAAKMSSWIGLPVAAVGIALLLWPHLPKALKIATLLVGVAAIIYLVEWVPGTGPVLNENLNRLIGYGVSRRLSSWYDWKTNGPMYWIAIRWQFVSFWSAFSWGVPGLPVVGIIPLAFLSGLSGLGIIWGLLKTLRGGYLNRDQWNVLIFWVVATLAIILLSLLRIDPPRPDGGSYIPTARHMYAAIIPLVTLFLVGLGSLIPAAYRKYGLAVLALGLYILGLWSVVSIQVPWFIENWPIGY